MNGTSSVFLVWDEHGRGDNRAGKDESANRRSLRRSGGAEDRSGRGYGRGDDFGWIRVETHGRNVDDGVNALHGGGKGTRDGHVGDKSQGKLAVGDIGLEYVVEPGGASEIANGAAYAIPAVEELAGEFGCDMSSDSGDEDQRAFGDGGSGFGHVEEV